MDRFADELRRLRAQRVLSLRELAAAVHYGKSYLHELETGRKPVSASVASRLDDALGAGGRDVIAELERENGRPRRVASAKLDLGLALLATGKADEAAAAASEAITSGRIVPSNWWRVSEVVAGVRSTGVTEARDLYEQYMACRPA
ncbi:helix-turn-helix domain-containing protein [Actinoplanes sp. NPDC049681]|uniref:helix-turn-helix domain-containing protein n=1 Tax=Actinoplanes sp. NPDC049681 TaxID=3363905 RepID=UPI00379800B1